MSRCFLTTETIPLRLRSSQGGSSVSPKSKAPRKREKLGQKKNQSVKLPSSLMLTLQGQRRSDEDLIDTIRRLAESAAAANQDEEKATAGALVEDQYGENIAGPPS
ncbi:hypothetical protein INS49_006931 [Diaporthe citri]|uniref:uncharacterized protein n=1 Tax=Diaporthe citri TaxID=83186 RepID=UPI001C7F360F|nr:uncharacterized protein INS49_006931 [Diaporthe citri]KAG6365322.1 hypothetical protein INS49_006931 [Diaporthe citri]